MTLIEEIASDRVQARKNKETVRASLLTTLYGEATKVGKDKGNRPSTDEEVIAVIKKFLKGIEAILEVSDMNPQALQERAILESYLPKQMSEEDLEACVSMIVSKLDDPNPKDMGAVMKSLKALYDGQYDGKMASQKVREALSS